MSYLRAPDVESAVNAVPENNSELYVIRAAKGEYSGKTVISLSKRIKIEGGWDENFSKKSNDPSETVLQHGQFGIVSVLANANTDIEVTVENLKITGAFSGSHDVGGGISASVENGGKIKLGVNRCVITNNSARHGHGTGIGIQSVGSESQINFTMDGSLIADNGTIYYYGGGIFIVAHSFGFLDATILNSIISNNKAMLGGGIAVSAWFEICYPDPHPPAGDVKLNIINTTITKNRAKYGGIEGGGKGGGLKLLAGYGNQKMDL